MRVSCRYASKAFVQVGHSLWTLDPIVANELERDIYERFLDREIHRKRKRHSHQSRCDVWCEGKIPRPRSPS